MDFDADSATISSLQKSYGQFITSGSQITLVGIGIFGHLKGVPQCWIVLLPVIAVISLFAWISTTRRRREIVGTPASRIASAAQGHVRLFGIGRPLDESPLFSHLTRQPCLWNRWIVRERKHKNKTVIVDSGESDVSFILDDGSGRCVVDVEGAEILTPHKETWHIGERSYTEWKLLEDDPIHVLGEFRTLGGASIELDVRRDMGELLLGWKKDPATLLKRFDLDRDGQLDEREWGLARQAARREVSRMHIEARNESDVHTLAPPSNGRCYLLSAIDLDRLARRYHWWSLFHLVFFLAALGAIPWANR